MKIYHMQTIATVLWVLMGVFFVLSIVLFFVWNIKKAWKIVTGTNFKVPVIKGLRGVGAMTGGLGTRNLGSRNLSSRNLSSKRLGSNSADPKSKKLNVKNLDSKKLSASKRKENRNPDSKELNSKKLAAGGGKTSFSYRGETVALEKYMQSVTGNNNILVQKGMSNVVETSVLTNNDFMNKTASESAMTAVLMREELEMVVDIMFTHTEEII